MLKRPGAPTNRGSQISEPPFLKCSSMQLGKICSGCFSPLCCLPSKYVQFHFLQKPRKKEKRKMAHMRLTLKEELDEWLHRFKTLHPSVNSSLLSSGTSQPFPAASARWPESNPVPGCSEQPGIQVIQLLQDPLMSHGFQLEKNDKVIF